jgi:rhamnosyltransferase
MRKMQNNTINQSNDESNLNDFINSEKKDGLANSAITVDVIIPVYKPDIKFNQLIERLAKQSVKPKHIFLMHTIEETQNIDQAEKARKTEEALKFAQSLNTNECKIERFDIKKIEFDHGGTRNYGASLSNADIILFMTQDAVPVDKDLIKYMVQPFTNLNVAASYGRQLAHQKAGVIEQYTRQFNYPAESYVKSIEDLKTLGIKTYFCSNVCAAYRRSIYNKLGGFVLKTIFNEDMIMAAGIIQNGYSISYAAEALVYHSHVYTYREQFKRNFDLAVSQKQYSHIFEAVKSEDEGIKYVKNTCLYLIKSKHILLIPDFIMQSGFKYLGFKCGKQYDKMPKGLIKKLSLNPTYWDQE